MQITLALFAILIVTVVVLAQLTALPVLEVYIYILKLTYA